MEDTGSSWNQVVAAQSNTRRGRRLPRSNLRFLSTSQGTCMEMSAESQNRGCTEFKTPFTEFAFC